MSTYYYSSNSCVKPKVYSQGNNKDGGMTFYRAQLVNLEGECGHIFKFKIKCHLIFLLHLDFLHYLLR